MALALSQRQLTGFGASSGVRSTRSVAGRVYLRRPTTERRLVGYNRPTTWRQENRASMVITRAGEGSTSGDDFDAFLNKLANKWEKSENKPIVVGYVAAALFAFYISEWLIHLPGLNYLLGFPVQLFGLLLLPYYGIRWFVDGGDFNKDLESYTAKIVEKLPGLNK
eukprot:jgi/Chrzof1/3671/Cz13g04150.t1